MSRFLLGFLFVHSEFFCFLTTLALFGLFVPLKSSIECNFNSTNIIFYIMFVHQKIDFGTILFLLLVIQTK